MKIRFRAAARWILSVIALLVITAIVSLGVLWGNVCWVWAAVPVLLWAGLIYKRTSKAVSWALLGAVIIDIGWALMPESNAGWKRYDLKYIQSRTLLERPRPEEDAAVLYAKLIGKDFGADEPNFISGAKESAISGPWNEAEHPESAKWLDERMEVFNAAEKISAMPIFTENQLASLDNPNRLMPKLRRLVMYLCAQAYREMAKGNYADAARRVSTIIGVANQVGRDKSYLGILNDRAFEGLGICAATRMMAMYPVTQEQLDSIIKAIGPVEDRWKALWPEIAEYGKQYTKDVLQYFYEINESGKVRFCRDPIRAMHPGMADVAIRRKWLKASMLPEMYFLLPHRPETAEAFFDEQFESLKDPNCIGPYEPWKRFRVDVPKPGGTLGHGMMKSMAIHFRTSVQRLAPRIRDTYQDLLNEKRGAVLVAALRSYHNEHGHWPDDINEVSANVPADALIDAQTHEKTSYSRNGERFVLFDVWPK